MTRGKLVLITNDGIYHTTEYNGDMYWDGNGEKAFNDVSKAETVADLEKLAKKWSSDYGYTDEYDLQIHKKGGDVNWFDFSDDSYIKKWFSDYLYIKNASNRIFRTIDENGDMHYLKKGETGSLCFGMVADDNPLNGFYHKE